LIETHTPFVSADRIPRNDVNYVTVENVESSRTAVNHLIKLGRRRIVIIAGDALIIDSLDRVEGYKLALADNNIPYDPSLVIIDRYAYDASYATIKRLLAEGIDFDGVYASQSTIAVGAVNALLDNGIRLPEDVSLVAFDDLADAMNPRIGISTMRQPVIEKGQQLASVLIDLIEDKIAPPIQRFLPAELVIRDTCGG
jgi:DNA-binding LacI/PurR family transcriptional regulator